MFLLSLLIQEQNSAYAKQSGKRNIVKMFLFSVCLYTGCGRTSHVSRNYDLVSIPMPSLQLGHNPVFCHDKVEFIPKSVVE